MGLLNSLDDFRVLFISMIIAIVILIILGVIYGFLIFKLFRKINKINDTLFVQSQLPPINGMPVDNTYVSQTGYVQPSYDTSVTPDVPVTSSTPSS